MARFIKLEGPDLWIETDTDRDSGEPVIMVAHAPPEDKVAIAFEKISGSLKFMCESLTDIIDQIPAEKKPTSFTASFGFKISGEGNIYVVKTSGEASLNFTAEWKVK